MQTLDIECPSCGEMLELDAGFAGGVCRCSSCGTLMTVPSDAGKAESLTRPTSSTQIGAGGMNSMGVPDPGTRDRSSRGKSKKGKGAKGKRISTTLEPGEYRTSSGKVIRVDEAIRVPMAEGKKKQIRVVTTVVFFSIVAAVVAVAVVGIIAITGGPGGPGGSGGIKFDPSANPYSLEFANVMGLPVNDSTVVIVEASEFSEEWMEVVGDIISAGLSQESKSGTIMIYEAATKEAVPLTGNTPTDLPLRKDQVAGWFEKMSNEGTADIGGAIKAALESDPGTIIIIHGYAEMSDIQAWDKHLEGEEELKLHIVHIGNSSPALEGWAGERGGDAVVLSIDDIEALKEMAADESEEE